MGQGKPPELRTHAKRVTSGRNMTPEEIAAAKNARAHARNLERKAKKRAEAEARNAAYQAVNVSLAMQSITE